MWQNKYADATAVAEAIRKQELKPVEAIQLAIDMIKTKNGQVNAVTSLRAEEALKEARELTDFAKPFAGVPILLKDLGHSMKGLPSTSGSRRLKTAYHWVSNSWHPMAAKTGYWRYLNISKMLENSIVITASNNSLPTHQKIRLTKINPFS